MSEWKVAMYVDGMIYVTVSADDEEGARQEAAALIGEDDFARVEWVQSVEPVR